MANEEFKISLGVELDPSASSSIKTQVAGLIDNTHRIKIDIDNSRLLKQIDHAKKALKGLNGTKGDSPSLTVNTKSLDQSLNRVADVIDEIKVSIGSLGKDANMKPLLTAINEISTALSDVGVQFKELLGSFNGFNLNLSLGGSKNPIAANAAYGKKARTDTIPQLKAQYDYLTNLLGGQEKIISQFLKNMNQFNGVDMFAKVQQMMGDMDDPSLAKQMEAYRQYIDYMKKLAKINDVPLDGFNAKFSKSAEELIDTTRRIQTGEAEAEDSMQKLQKIFGGSNIDAEKLTQQLDSIVEKLGQIGESVANLSSGISVDGLADSFNNLSSSIQELVSNCSGIRTVVANSVDGVGSSVGNVVNAVSDIGNINLKATEQQINNMKTAMNNFGFDKSSIDVAVRELKDMNLVINNITTKLNSDGSINLTIKGVDESGRAVTAIRAVRQEVEELGDGSKEVKAVVDNLGTTISQSFNQAEKQPEEVINAFKRMQQIISEMSSIEMQFKGLDPKKNANEINALNARLIELNAEYGRLNDRFSESFNTNQIDSLNNAWDKFSHNIDATKAKFADTSKEKYFKEIEGLAGEISSIEIKIKGLDNKSNKNEIAELTARLNTLRDAYEQLISSFNFNDSNLSIDDIARLNQVFEETKNKLALLDAKMRDAASVQEYKSQCNELYTLLKQMGNLEIKIGSLDGKANENEIAELTNQLNTLRDTYERLMSSFNFDNPNLSIDDIARLNNIVEETKNKLTLLDAKIADTKQRTADGIKLKFDNGTFANDMNKVEVSLSKIKTQSTEVVTGMQSLNAAFLALETAKSQDDVEELIRCYDRYQNALKNVKNQIEVNQRAEQQNVDASKLNSARQALSSQMDVWLKRNSAAAKQFGGEIEALKAKLNSCDAIQLNGIKSEFNEIKRQAELAGKNVQTFGDKLKSKMGELGTYFSASMIISEGIQAVRAMYDNVVEVDTAMTGLYRVTDLTATQYDALYDSMIVSAKEYGSTLTDVINSTADWVRLGFDANTANQLSEITAMYQHISDLDNDTAVENLVTAYKGFQDQLLNLYDGDEAAAIEYIADIFNELDNNFAVTADGIGTALTKSASALELAGNTIQESAAMVTGITEVTQDPEKAGSALKILSLRLRGMKGELQELGEDVDENVESLSKMQTQILNLTHGKVNIFNDDGSFKSTYEIMDAIAEVYDKLSSTDQADLLETIAGKNRANDVAALLSNWQQVEAAMKSAMEAEGSAAEEQKKHMDSIQGRLDALTATWQALSNTIVNSDFVKVLITGLTGVLDLLDAIVKTLGSFGSIGAGFAIFQLFKHVGDIKAYISVLNEFGWSFKNLGAVAKMAGADLKAFGATSAGIATGIGLVITVISTAIQTYRNLEAEQARLRQKTLDTNNDILSSVDTFEQAYVKYAGKTDLTAEEENELTTAINNTITALGGKSSAIQGVIDKNNDYIDSLENVARAELEEAQRKAKESLDAATEGLQSNSWDLWSGSEITVSLGTSKSNDVMQKARSIAESIMADYIDKEARNAGRGSSVVEYEIEPLNWDKNHENMDAVVDYYYKLIELKYTLLQKSIDEKDDSYINNDVYDNAKSTIDALSNSVEEYLTQQYNLAKYGYEIQNGIPKTVEEYVAMKNAILGNIDASQEYKDAIADIADAEWGQIFDLDSLTENVAENVAEYTAEQKQKVIESFKDNSITEWFSVLRSDEKELIYEIGVKSDDTTLWTLTRWAQELAYLKENGETTAESMTKFYDLMNGSGDKDGMSEFINNYVSNIQSLQDAYNQLSFSGMDESERLSLATSFPSLAPYINDTSTLKDEILNLMNTMSQDNDSVISNQIKELEENSPAAAAALEQLRIGLLELVDTDFTFDIDSEIEGFNKLHEAMDESVSATGLTTESIDNLKAAFAGLPSYNPSQLFEHTTNGIHLNEEALKQLIAEYEEFKGESFETKLKTLKDEYDNITAAIANTTEGTAEWKNLVNQQTNLANQIEEVQTLATQYEGLTSAYNKWVQAQSGSNERDSYESVGSNYDEMEEIINSGWYGDESLGAYLDLILGENRDKIGSVQKQWEQLTKTISGTKHNIMDYWKFDKETGELTTDGLFDFLDDVRKKFGDTYASVDENGDYSFDLTGNKLQEVADAFGMSTEMVELFAKALIDAGMEVKFDPKINIDDAEVEALESDIETINDGLERLGKEPVDINVNANTIETVDSEIDKAKKAVEELSQSTFAGQQPKFGFEVEYEAALNTLDILIQRKIELENPAFMSINTSQVDDTELQNALILVQNYQNAVNELKAEEIKGIDTSYVNAAKTKVEEATSAIQTFISTASEDTKIALGISTDDLDTATLQTKISEIPLTAFVSTEVKDADTVIAEVQAEIDNNGTTVTVPVKTGAVDDTTVQEYQNAEHDASGTFNWINDSSNVDTWASQIHESTGVVKWKDDVTNVETHFEATGSVKWSGTAPAPATAGANGTAHSNGSAFVNGTMGKAYKQGDWGTKDSGVALMGELGRELLVRDGRYYTVGDESAEFVKYQKGDIIFNHKQTEELFKYGKVTSNGGRGKAFVEGTAFGAGGTGGTRRKKKTTTTSASKTSTSSSSKSSSSSSKSSSSTKKSSSSKNNFEETFDWIEIAIDRVERAISNLDLTASSVYQSWSNRNKSLKQEMSEIEKEIILQQQGYERYMQQANSVGLSSAWKKKVQNGEVDIDKVTNESTAEKIKEYQEWYEKALDCKYAVDELGESLSECYQTAFDMVVAQYDGILAVIGHEKSILDEYIAQSEAQGYVTSSKYYEALIENESNNIEELGNKKNELLAKLEDGLTSGAVEKESEAWYEMVNQIDEVTLAIEQGNTAIIEYANSIRDIEWELFDILQSQISQITKESDFLINLLSSDKLYDDKGRLTNEGMATAGLHGQNYNVYMAQADKYAQEILNIDKELANNPYNQDLINRRQELLELQQESILAAEDEKQAIIDMVSEGIELELDALQELIDSYTDALDAQKDLYDYQKKVAEQTKKIADLEKQMSAYAGDGSEEARTKIQQIKVSLEEAKTNLEETEYDRYISDQKKLFDELYIEYETILNQRLDNVDALLEDMILEINNSANSISTTISEKAESVGYTLSESMNSIWSNGNTEVTSVLTTYGKGIQDGINNVSTTVSTTIGAVNSNLQNMIMQLNTISDTKVDVANTSSSANSNQTKTNTSSDSSNSSNSSNSDSSSSSSSSNSSNSSNNTSNSNSSKKRTEKEYYGVALAIWNGNYGWGNGSTRNDRLKKKGFDANKVKTIINKIGKDGYVSSGKWVGKYHGITSLSPYHYNKFADGKKNINRNQWALTQEKGLEMIVRPSDGAILTPIAKYDSVLDAKASNNIWDMSNNPSEFIKDNLKLNEVSTPICQNVQNAYTQHLEKVVFNMPNVKNYEDLLSAMQHDKNFERLIMAMTIDQVAGKTSLAKGKSIR